MDLIFQLSDAAMDGDLDAVKRLVQSGADPSCCIEGNTALAEAVVGRHYQVVAFLLKSGANPNWSESTYSHPIYRALDCRDRKMIKLLFEYGAELDGKIFLSLLPQRDDPELIKIANDTGFDLNYREGKWGRSPLHITCMYGYEKSTEVLLALGATVAVLDHNGQKPTDLAMINRHFELFNFVEKYESA